MDMRTLITITEARIFPLGKSAEDLDEMYMEGSCWSLAIALHRMYGWPIVCLGGYEDEDERDDWRTIEFFHVLVRHPSGSLLDVRGLRDEAAELAEWGDVEVLPLTEEQLHALFRHGNGPKPSDIAFASKVVAYYLRPKFPDLFPAA
jgi:hypothetical protein